MTEDDVPDEVIIAVTDYLDGSLPASEKAAVEAKIAADPMWKATHDEMIEARKVISGMRKATPPPTFTEDITATIHKRSGGRFFARRTLGDRVPFGVLLVLALLAFAVVGYLMWSSPTGSLKSTKQPDAPATQQPRLELRP